MTGGTIASFIEAMAGIAMRRENGNLVAQVLQAYRCIDDETFSAANAEIWMEEDDTLGFAGHVGGCYEAIVRGTETSKVKSSKK